MILNSEFAKLIDLYLWSECAFCVKLARYNSWVISLKYFWQSFMTQFPQLCCSKYRKTAGSRPCQITKLLLHHACKGRENTWQIVLTHVAFPNTETLEEGSWQVIDIIGFTPNTSEPGSTDHHSERTAKSAWAGRSVVRSVVEGHQ